MNWDLTIRDFARDEYITDSYSLDRDGVYIEVYKHRTYDGAVTGWMLDIFHDDATICAHRKTRKACLEAIPKLMRAFES
jgi:hypothetical protein